MKAAPPETARRRWAWIPEHDNGSPNGDDTRPSRSRGDTFSRYLLWVSGALFAGSVVFSLGGMTLMRFAPGAAAQAGGLLPWLMKVPTWINLTTLPLVVFLMYRRNLGTRASIFFLVWGSFVGMMAELIGTGTGYPFGAYAYTSFLEPKIMGDVPYFIPLSWYAIALISYDFAIRLNLSGFQRLAATALFMVLWDVALDPAMGAGFPIWEWRVEGFFYQMPAINWVGWFITSLVIAWGFEYLGGRQPRTHSRWPIWVWIVNGALAVGICALAGLGGAVLAGSMALAIPVLALWRRAGSMPNHRAA
jgi:putative membrane protein